MRAGKPRRRAERGRGSRHRTPAGERGAAWEGRATTLAPAVVVGALVGLWFLVPGTIQTCRLAEIVALCLLIVAGSRWTLLGSTSDKPREQACWTGRAQLGPMAMVLGAAIAPYLPALSVGFLSDDYGMLAMARSVHSLGEAWHARPLPQFLRPLPMVAWWSGVGMWGGSPLGYHAFNLLLHGANSVLVYAVAGRMTGSSYAALTGALLFALHPLHVEPVAWPCSNSDLLCAFFSLVSLLLLEAHLGAAGQRRRWAALAGALTACALALLSKEAALALPAVAVLWAILAGRERRWARLALVAGAYGVALVAYLGWRTNEIGGMGGYRLRTDLWVALFPSALLRHLVAFLFPVNRELFSGGAALIAVVTVMAAGALWWVYGIHRTPASRTFLWLGFFALMTTPVALLSAGTPNLEGSRLAYLPTIGLAWLFGDLCANRGWRQSRAVLVIALVTAAGLTSWYLMSWREAGRRAERVIARSADLLTDLEQREGDDSELYLQGPPDTHRGAQVMRNCLSHAVTMRRGRVSRVHVIGQYGDVRPDTMSLTALLPGQHLAAWEESRGDFKILRSGVATDAAVPGGQP